MPKVSKEYSEVRRQQIIDAAYRCFARKGFHQTTMREIYEEARLSAGAVYLYFESKAEIIQSSFDFDYQRSHALFEAARTSDDPLRALEDLLSYLLHGLKGASALEAPRVNVQGWGEALVNPSLQHTFNLGMDYYRQTVTEIISKAQAAGQIDRSLDPLSLSRLLLSTYYGLELQLALDPELDVEGYAATIRTLLRSAVLKE